MVKNNAWRHKRISIVLSYRNKQTGSDTVENLINLLADPDFAVASLAVVPLLTVSVLIAVIKLENIVNQIAVDALVKKARGQK